MAATDHPIVLDLGQVRGLVVTNGKPSDSDGAEGELRIDPSNGNVWKRTGGAWILLCQLALAGNVKQSDWNQSSSSAIDFIKNKPTIPAAQVNADWASSSGVSRILNKPTISSSIAEGGTNLVPAGAIYTELAKKVPVTPVSTTIGMGGTGSDNPTATVEKYGPIVFFSIANYNQDESVWKRTINLGKKGTADVTRICNIPADYRFWSRQTALGFVYFQTGAYNARFYFYGAKDPDAPGDVYVESIFDDDWNRVTSGSSLVTSLTVTGYSVNIVGHIAG